MFAIRTFKMDEGSAESVAQDAVTKVWEAVKYGHATADSFADFWALTSAQIYKERTEITRMQNRCMSLDDEWGEEGSATRHDSGFFGHTRATQIDTCYAHQIEFGIGLLPERLRDIMQRIAGGESALDISRDLDIPVHAVFARIKAARILLMNYDLVGIANNGLA